MFESVKLWIVSVLIGAFIVNIVDMLLPKSSIKPYINLVLNFIFVFIVITPVVNFFSNNISMEDRILKSMNEYNKKYEDSSNYLAKETGTTSSLSSGYEESLREVIKLKLDEYGYDLEDIELDGSKINNIKIKEKNSNKESQTNIESSEKENSKEVFNKKDVHELKLNQDKLKDDLVKVLDVSVETIHIDK
ncbi:stage III sporulation protein AF [Metaclostridioides mangenotii]|uniref:stage III sporulation protein AF n=1 Tax=Metaclostridioides mangenotii TaxID=1540 RepID=UPI0004668F7A|nr:stage III sporulation protein AF [Clostridioides mangenotii]